MNLVKMVMDVLLMFVTSILINVILQILIVSVFYQMDLVHNTLLILKISLLELIFTMEMKLNQITLLKLTLMDFLSQILELSEPVDNLVAMVDNNQTTLAFLLLKDLTLVNVLI